MANLTDLTTATDLDTLCRALNGRLDEARAAMRAGDERDAELRTQEIEGVLTRLPVFGGVEPRNTDYVYSWDTTRIMRYVDSSQLLADRATPCYVIEDREAEESSIIMALAPE